MNDDDHIYLSDASEPEIIRPQKQKASKPAKHPQKRKAVDKILNMYKEELRLNFKAKNYENLSMNELLKTANQSFLIQDYQKVINTCLEIIQLSPNNVEAFNLLYLVYEDMGDAKKSTDFLFIKTKTEKSTSAAMWYTIYEKYIGLEELESAYYCLSRALKFEPNDKQLLLSKAQLLERLNDSKRAVSYYEKLIKLDPFDFTIIRRVGKIYILQNKLKEALAILLRYIGHHQFIENIDLNIFFIALDLTNKLEMYNYTIILLETFILNFSKYTLFIQKMLKRFESEASLEIESLDPFIVNDFDKDSKLSAILKNYPLEITYQYFKALLCSGNPTAFQILELISLEKVLTFDEIAIDLIKILIDNKCYDEAQKKTEYMMLFNLTDDLKLAMLKLQAKIYEKLGLFKNEIKVCKQIIYMSPNAYKYKLRLSKLLNRSHRIKTDKIIADNEEIYQSSEEELAIDQPYAQEVVEHSKTIANYTERTLDKHINAETFKLRMYNPKLLDTILSYINDINKNYPKELFDLLYEKAKNTNPRNKLDYTQNWFDILSKAIELEHKRNKFILFLTEAFSKESLKELIKMHKFMKDNKKYPLMFSRTNKIRKTKKSDKKVYFTHKMINYYKNLIFSLVNNISFKHFDLLCDKVFTSMFDLARYSDLNALFIKLFELSHLLTSHPDFFVKSCFRWYAVAYELHDFDLAIFCLKRVLGFMINRISSNQTLGFSYSFSKVLDSLSVICMNINFFVDRIVVDKNVVYSHLHKLLKNMTKRLQNHKQHGVDECKDKVTKLCISIYNLRGNMYFLNSTYDLALKFYNLSNTFQFNNDKLSSFMSVLCNINLTLSRKNSDPKSTFQQALTFFKEYSKNEDKYLMYYNLHRLLVQVGAYDKVEQVFESVSRSSDLNETYHQQKIFYQMILNTIIMYSKIKNNSMIDIITDHYINN